MMKTVLPDEDRYEKGNFVFYHGKRSRTTTSELAF
jgi:hypothetical protein